MSNSTKRVNLLVGVALAAVACSGGGGEPAARSTPCPTPAAARNTKGLPGDLKLERFGIVTRVERRGGAVGAEVVSNSTIVELYPPVARALLGAGYEIISGENDGFDAEIFFARGDVAGAYRMREGPCEGQVTIKVLYGLDRGRA